MGSRMEVVGRKHEPLPGPRCRLPLDGIAALRSTSTVHPSSPRHIAVWFSADSTSPSRVPGAPISLKIIINTLQLLHNTLQILHNTLHLPLSTLSRTAPRSFEI